MAKETESKYCIRCNKVLKISDFYKSNNTDKYPDGHVDLCKQCFVAHLDNWDPETQVPLLEEVDVPYVPNEWNRLLANYAGNPDKMTPTTIIGKQLAKMKLNQFKKYRFADSETLQKIDEKEKREVLEKQGKSESEIQEILAAGQLEPPPKPEGYVPNGAENNNFVPTGEDADLGIDLTEEDLTYLRLKWGRNYRPFEYVQLEQLYNDMMASYDIQTAGHIDTLKMICKTSLKANQLLDLGDVDGALKMTRAYDTLMKSGKFTAAQNKAESGEFVDSIGEIAMMCEKHEFIPVYYTEQPEDKVDWVIKDNQNYVKKLITEEMNLADLLDKALKDIEEDREREEDKEADEDGFEQDLFSEVEQNISDEDIIKFKEFEEELEQADITGVTEKKAELKKEIKANEKKRKPNNIVIKKRKKEDI